MPAVAGVMERRLLVNYRLDPDVAAALLPAPFRPQLVNGYAVAGICLIRLGRLRPAWLPFPVGVRTENAAHRFAVTWEERGETRHGVYIPRRDTSSWVSAALGGRVFTGEYHRARFDVVEDATRLRVAFASRDGDGDVAVDVSVAPALTGSRLFADLGAASAFFEAGSDGFSASRDGGRYDGMALRTNRWAVEAGHVHSARSSFFDALPPGSAELDCALVMRHVPVVWDALPALRTAAA
ncbi:MAG TPA: DUF2071 domain-containing protein [Mycobacteriales bacterium]|jgi:uncharacterized protein YqjF (DUF2071 family)|nr:DUF2071 domain-containing protein [Mycobacteriales bacterium]